MRKGSRTIELTGDVHEALETIRKRDGDLTVTATIRRLIMAALKGGRIG